MDTSFISEKANVVQWKTKTAYLDETLIEAMSTYDLGCFMTCPTFLTSHCFNSTELRPDFLGIATEKKFDKKAVI